MVSNPKKGTSAFSRLNLIFQFLNNKSASSKLSSRSDTDTLQATTANSNAKGSNMTKGPKKNNAGHKISSQYFNIINFHIKYSKANCFLIVVHSSCHSIYFVFDKILHQANLQPHTSSQEGPGLPR